MAERSAPTPPALKPRAVKRAFSLARLLDGGMNYADAVELHALVDSGHDWRAAAETLAEKNEARATRALAAGHRATAKSWLLFASACWRFGQGPLGDDDPAKRRMYERVLDTFAHGGALHDPPYERLDVPLGAGSSSGWLVHPAHDEPRAIVIVFGGIDAWREEHEMAARYLNERGMSTLLLDMPGQGEPRLFADLHLGDETLTGITRVLDALGAHRRAFDRVGIWGNSAGGWMAVHMAAHDRRILACCVNGGTDDPSEILERFPSYISRLSMWTGCADPAEALARVKRLRVTPEVLRQVRCPLHIVHGTPDRIFVIEGARRIHAGAASEDKTFTEFADGEHGIVNRAHERHTLIADWLADRLRATPT